MQGFVNSASKFNSTVVKTLKPVSRSFRDGVPLKFKKETWRHYGLSLWIVRAWFFTPVKSRWTVPLKSEFPSTLALKTKMFSGSGLNEGLLIDTSFDPR